MWMSQENLILAGAIVATVVIKVAFFFYYAYKEEKKNPQSKKQVPYDVIQQGLETTEQNGKAPKRVLVTGGCGFLGSSIVRHLHKRMGDRISIVVLDNAVHDKFGPLLPAATYIRGDVTVYSHVYNALAGCAGVVHSAAALALVNTSPALLERVNLGGTKNVVEACLERDVGALVYTSSVSVVLDVTKGVPSTQPPPPPLDEDTPLPPLAHLNGDYARSKSQAEQLVRAANSHCLKTVVLRPGSIYGLEDSCLMYHVARGDPFAGPGLSVPAPVWVEDAARAHALALEHLLFPPTPASTATTTTSSSAGSGPAAPPPRIQGRAFHLAHDMARDRFLYGEFVGAALASNRPQVPLPAKQQQQNQRSASDKSSSSSSGSELPPPPAQPPGVNAYGRPPCRPLPRWLVGLMATANEWVGQRLGMVLVDPFLRPENMFYLDHHWPLDITNAQQLLGWQPTPWRSVAAHLGRQMAERKAGGAGLLGAEGEVLAGAGAAVGELQRKDKDA